METKAVIFDMDGVLFDSERLVLDCWEKIGEKYKIVDIRKVFTECIGTNRVRTQEIIYDYYGKSFHYEEFRQEASCLFQEIIREKGLPIKKGVKELLRYLQDIEIPIGLASSTRQALVEAELQQTGLYDYFQVIMGGDQLKRSKPEPDIYLMACDKMKIAPEYVYAIEDSHNGIRAAYSAGMKPIMVPDLLPVTEEMKEKSIAVFDDLLQVLHFFKENLSMHH